LNLGVVDEGGSSQLTRNSSLPATPTTPVTPTTPQSARKPDNVWRSVFNPGSNSATRSIGAHVFDKPLPNTPTVYDWYDLHIYLSNHISHFHAYNKSLFKNKIKLLFIFIKYLMYMIHKYIVIIKILLLIMHSFW
jgi:hypothetical protein